MGKEPTTIRDIVPHLKWKDVKRAIKYFYPTDKNDYEPVFEQLKIFRKRKHKDLKEFIEVYSNFDINNVLTSNTIEEKYNEVCYGMATNKYAMDFRGWRGLANIPISEETLKHYTPIEIVAHFIWEITFYGDEKGTAKAGKQVFDAHKEAVKDLAKKAKKTK